MKLYLDELYLMRGLLTVGDPTDPEYPQMPCQPQDDLKTAAVTIQIPPGHYHIQQMQTENEIRIILKLISRKESDTIVHNRDNREAENG